MPNHMTINDLPVRQPRHPAFKLLVVCLWLIVLAMPTFGETTAARPSLELSQPLRVTFTEFRPYAYTDYDGQTKGYVLDILKQSLAELQWPYRLGSRPTARIYHQLKQGELDIWVGSVGVPTLKPHVWEVPLPDQFSISLYLWRKPETAPAPEISDLAGSSVVVINGYTYRGLIHNLENPQHQIRLYRSNNHENALKMLISGRVDYLLDYRQPIELLLENLPDVKVEGRQIQNRQVGFMVSRKATQSRKLFEALRQVVEQRTKIPVSE